MIDKLNCTVTANRGTDETSEVSAEIGGGAESAVHKPVTARDDPQADSRGES